MASGLQIVVVGDDDHDRTLDQALARTVGLLDELEARWSRFLPDSDITRLNNSPGAWVDVDPFTVTLVVSMIEAWQATAGAFDPSVLPILVDAGYRASIDDPWRVTILPDGQLVALGNDAGPTMGDIEVDRSGLAVRLPAGLALDPGGIGKGLAADLVATAAVDLGADGAMVSLGGDLRVAGSPPADGWEIELDHHVVAPARINLLDGAIATSSTLRRRWSTAGGPAHHVIDPRTGRPSTGPLVACSVVAAEAWWAEALATALLVGWGEPGSEQELLDLLDGAGALLTFADGRQLAVGPLADSFSPGRSL